MAVDHDGILGAFHAADKASVCGIETGEVGHRIEAGRLVDVHYFK